MADKLSDVLNQLSISAGVFYTGTMCGHSSFDEPGARYGHMHVLKQGEISLLQGERTICRIDEPSLIFFPRATSHRLVTQNGSNAELVCATVEFGAGGNNPLANAFPDYVSLSLSRCPNVKHATQWLFDEAFEQQVARQPMLDRLAEIIVIELLRVVVREKTASQGLLNGIVHPQLGKLLQRLHLHPENEWNLDSMAAASNMSRSKFASTFKATMGQTPADYLLDWRVSLAQVYLDKGQAVNWVANKVGYDSSSTLARAFKKKTGESPSAWLNRVREAQ